MHAHAFVERATEPDLNPDLEIASKSVQKAGLRKQTMSTPMIFREQLVAGVGYFRSLSGVRLEFVPRCLGSAGWGGTIVNSDPAEIQPMYNQTICRDKLAAKIQSSVRFFM
jgi:hypothetical protein